MRHVRGHVYPVEAGVRLGQAVGGRLHAVDGEQAGARRPRGALEGAETLQRHAAGACDEL